MGVGTVPIISTNTGLRRKFAAPILHQDMVLTMVFNMQDTVFFSWTVNQTTDTQTLKHYVSEGGSSSFFRQEAPNLLDPLHRTMV